MIAPRVSCTMFVVLVGLVCRAGAQVVQGPPGGSSGLFGSGSGTVAAPQLSVTFDQDGGYEDNRITETTAEGDSLVPIQSGYVATGAATLSYRVGRPERSLVGVGSGSVSQQQVGGGLPSYRLIRGSGQLRGTTNIGRRSRLNMMAESSYEPAFLFGTFDTLGRNVSTGQTGSSTGLEAPASFRPSLTSQRWLASQVGGDTSYSWTPRQRTSIGYSVSWLRPLSGVGFESRARTTALEHAWRPTGNTAFELSYRNLSNPQRLDDGFEQRLGVQTAEGRLRYERRLSPRRSLAFMAGGGAARVDASGPLGQSDIQLTSPTVSASVRLGVVSSWGMSLTTRRDVTVLFGLSPEPFSSNAVLVSLDGTARRRLTFDITGGYSQGRTLVGARGAFDQTMIDAMLRYGFGTRVGVTVLYSYNNHEFQNVSVVPSSFPTNFGRNSVRVGLTFWLPLYGRF
ncbi:hypothetical protein [Luteitalea sp.]|uniref:hypothetical protein n=1 Tax=Luteitalea sp. TaxID=2004800 RepID=UPI0025BFAF4B|nr:hypothetical protein [Luteitalea sp.]